MTNRAVFLDRDGVLNRSIIRNGRPNPPTKLSELEILPGVPEAIMNLRAANFRLIVITNQPDVARGTQTREAVKSFNEVLQAKLQLDEFRVCYHDDADNCNCRKPAPGLLLKAANDSQLDLKSCFLVGDRWRDIEAGHRAGCTTIFIDYAYAERRPSGYNVKVKSLFEASEWICSK